MVVEIAVVRNVYKYLWESADYSLLCGLGDDIVGQLGVFILSFFHSEARVAIVLLRLRVGCCVNRVFAAVANCPH